MISAGEVFVKFKWIFLSHLSSEIPFIALINFTVLNWIVNALLAYIIEHTEVKKLEKK